MVLKRSYAVLHRLLSFESVGFLSPESVREYPKAVGVESIVALLEHMRTIVVSVI